MGTATSKPESPPAWQSVFDGDAWRARYTQVSEQVKYQLSSSRTVALYETLAGHVGDATTGGVVFWLGISTAQLVQRAARVGAATPIAPRIIGTLAVGSSSVLALHFASFPREMYESFMARPEHSRQNPVMEAASKLQTRIQDLRNAPFTVYMVMGILSFKMLGGRMSSLAPSHYANLGAFHLKKASLPATELYADTVERGVIQQFGRLYGCHTCGVKRATMYHADHMPPKLVAKRMNEGIWRRLTGREVVFRYYPQCAPCSNQQATVVKMGRTDLKMHLPALRLYHTTGFWLVLLCTGGLYVGGSSFSETADVHQPHQLKDNHTRKDHRDDDLAIAASSSDHALLVSLREREKKLRRQRRATKRDDTQLLTTIDAELRSIEECKQRLKDSLQR